MPFGIAMIMISAVVGGALDFNRWHSAKRATSDALDAAVLAGARALQISGGNTTTALATAQAFFQRNVEGRVDLSVNTVSFALADDNQALVATGTAKIDATFLKLVGLDKLTVLSDTGANMPKAKITSGGQGGSNLELAMVLDVTGSMCDNGTGPCTSSVKMDGLKTAANKLIDMVVPATQTTYYSKMAIVPFASNVRVGPDGGGAGIMQQLTNLNPTWSGYRSECQGWTQVSTGSGESGDGWNCTGGYATVQITNWRVIPCVTDRFYDSIWDLDYTDDLPGSGKWLNAIDGGRMPRSWDSSDTTPTTGLGASASDPMTFWNYNSNGTCWDSAQSNEVLPLTTNIANLKSKISGLEAYGPTGGALGTAWGWYTLSPNWSTIFTGQSAPGSYGDLTSIQSNGKPVLRKVAVIMSDGVFNTYRGWGGQDQQTMSNYAKQLCTNMKAQGIEIFTVGLALDQLTTSERLIAEDTLRSCGTDVSHFYATLNAAELQQAFQDIGYQLSGIALTR